MPSFMKNWSSNTVLWLNNPRVGWRSGRQYAELQRTQWLSSGEMEAFQEAKIRRLIEHARTRVPFFKDYPPWPDAGGGAVRDQLAAYPILTKEAIRKCASALRQASGLPRFYVRGTTGGTTGAPIEVWRDRHHHAMGAAAYWRSLGWVGIKPQTRGVLANAMGKVVWYGRLRMRLANKMRVDAIGKSMEEKRRLALQIRDFHPGYIAGYVSDLLALGPACHEAGVRIGLVLTTGEMLYEHQRQELGRSYGGKVASYYGCNEVGSMAFECEQGRMHVADEHVLVEVVDDGGVPVWDQPGRILLTDLDNRLTPFIRYEVDDVGVLTRDPCPCGRRLTVLKSLDGRTQDALVNAAGDRLSTVCLAGKFRNLRAIHRIQLVQRTVTEIELLYEGAEPGMESERTAIVAEIHQRLGSQMRVTPRSVENLVFTRRGKCRLVVSLNETIRDKGVF